MDQKYLIRFLGIWIATSITALVLSYILGNNLVLGNASISQAFASVVFGLILTIVFFIVGPLSKKLDVKVKDERAWTVIFFVINIVTIWILKRLADFTGVGISNILIVLVVGALVTVVERFLDKYGDKYLKTR